MLHSSFHNAALTLLISLFFTLTSSHEAFSHDDHGHGARYYETGYAIHSVDGEHNGLYPVYHGSSLQEACEKGTEIVEATQSEVEVDYITTFQIDDPVTGKTTQRGGNCFYTHKVRGTEDQRQSWFSYLTVKQVCEFENANNGVVTRYNECPEEPIDTCTATAGNPLTLSLGNKLENVTDWASSVDARFKFQRTFNSNLPDKSFERANFGIGWGSSLFASATYKYGNRTYNNRFVSFGDGRVERYIIPAWFYGRPPRAETPDFDPQFFIGGGNGVLDRVLFPDGRLWEFDRITDLGGFPTGYRHLVKKSWPDGYKIEFTYDPVTGRLSSTEDNRDQRAEFTWNDTSDLTPPLTALAAYEGSLSPTGQITLNSTLNPRAQMSRAVDAAVAKIEIDTHYDGIGFAPDVRLDYDYGSPSYYFPDRSRTTIQRGTNLNRALATDIASGQILSDFSYEYDSEHNGLLTGISDNRPDATGGTYNFATFGYATAGTSQFGRARAVNSQHFGGADNTTVGNPALMGSNSADAHRTYDVTVTNELNKDTVYTFERLAGRHRVTNIEGISTSNCLPSNTSLTRDENGRVIEQVQKNGARTILTRDDRGRTLIRTEDADGIAPRVTTYTYSGPNAKLLATRVTSELAETFTYDAVGLLTSYSQEDVLVGSPNFGDVRTWTFTYKTLASGLKVMTSLDGPGLASDGVNDITTYTYNERGQLLTTTDPNGLTQEVLAYGVTGQPTLIKDHQGFEWALEYDLEGQLTRSAFQPNGVNDVTTYSYDIIGQMTSSTDALGRTWDYTYDEAKRLTEITAPSGETISFDHDAMGNVTRTEYADSGAVTRYLAETQFDELGRILLSLGSNGQSTAFSHDVEDNLSTVTDATSLTTSLSYDALNRMTDLVDRANFTTLMDHDESDQMTSFTDPRGIATSFQYNGFGELVSETSADRGNMTYAYNNRGLATSMTDGRAVMTNYAYDNGGRLLSKTFPSDSSLNQTFVYHANSAATQNVGNLANVSDQAGSMQMTYAADRGLLEETAIQLDSVAYSLGFEHDSLNQLRQMTYPSGRVVSYVYDVNNRLIALDTSASSVSTNPTGELVQNGDFEDISGGTGSNTQPAGWVKTGDRGGVYNAPANRGEGHSFVLGGWSNVGGQTLSQTLSTVPGNSYGLSFLAGSAWSSFTGALEVSVNGAVIASYDDAALGNTIAPRAANFTASSAQTTLTFRFAGTGTGDIDIDNVSVEQLSSGPLVQNGDFEDISGGTGSNTQPAGWTKTGSGGGVYNGSASRSDGHSFVLGGWSNVGGQTLSQTLATVPGTSYGLSFLAGGAWSSFTGALEVSVNGAVIASYDDAALGNTIAPRAANFTASSAQTTLTFRFAGTGAGDIDIDNVSVAQLSSGPLVQNGDFEDISGGTGSNTQPAGWVKTGDRGGVYNAPANRGEGHSFVLGGWSNVGGQTLSQTLSTVPGNSYGLSFLAGSAWSSFTGALEVSVNGAVIASYDDAALGNTIAPRAANFTASSAQTTLTFRFAGTGAGDIDIDNVAVVKTGGGPVQTQTVLSNLTYLPFGPLAAMTYGDGSTHTAAYDSSYRLTRLLDNRSGTTLRDVSYGWTNRDNLSTVTDNLAPAQSETYGYSSREFLSSADGAWGERDWLYDSVGNRTQQMSYANGSTSTDVYTYPNTSNRLDQIVFSTGGARTLTYDAAGNVTFDNRNGPGYGYNYDAAGRMSSFAINGVIQAEYEYNSLGQQVIRRLTQLGQTIHSIHDTAGNRIAEYDYDESTGTSSLIREYIWANGQVVGVFENGQLYYVRTDHIGRPSFATNNAGVKVWEASYLPFGGVQTFSGPNPELRFPGQWFQSETGLHQNWMRDYDPTTGRYMQADPLGLVPGPSLYGYAYQSPMMYIDPDGENPFLIGAGIGLAWGVLQQYLQHGADIRCYNWLSVGASGLGGAALGGATPALWGTAAGIAGKGGYMVNGMLHSSRAGLSTAFPNVSRQIARATGNSGSNHHWLIAQSWRISQWANQYKLGQQILNSRILMNRISKAANSSIGNRIFSRNNFINGVPRWVSGGAAFGSGGAALSWLGGDSQECSCEQ